MCHHDRMRRRRKLQLSVSAEQYRYLRERAGTQGSMAAVVRELIEQAMSPTGLEDDPFYRHVMTDRPGSGRSYDAEAARRELYRA